VRTTRTGLDTTELVVLDGQLVSVVSILPDRKFERADYCFAMSRCLGLDSTTSATRVSVFTHKSTRKLGSAQVSPPLSAQKLGPLNGASYITCI
jgi:hypothetical protein